jgi:hypothetical protein
MQHRADVSLKIDYVAGVGHRVVDFTINGMKMDRVVEVIFEASAEDTPIMTIVMLPTAVEIEGECPVEQCQISPEDAEDYDDEDDELDPDREFRN